MCHPVSNTYPQLQRQVSRVQRQRCDRGELGDPGEDYGTEQGAAGKGGQDGRADGRSGGCRHKHQYQT